MPFTLIVDLDDETLRGAIADCNSSAVENSRNRDSGSSGIAGVLDDLGSAMAMHHKLFTAVMNNPWASHAVSLLAVMNFGARSQNPEELDGIYGFLTGVLILSFNIGRAYGLRVKEGYNEIEELERMMKDAGIGGD